MDLPADQDCGRALVTDTGFGFSAEDLAVASSSPLRAVWAGSEVGDHVSPKLQSRQKTELGPGACLEVCTDRQGQGHRATLR